MKQSALDQSVARATGETVDCIRRRGFTLLRPPARRHRKRPRQSEAGQQLLPHTDAVSRTA